jgi:hypothetical protein
MTTFSLSIETKSFARLTIAVYGWNAKAFFSRTRGKTCTCSRTRWPPGTLVKVFGLIGEFE